jgi:hypothetical protein
MPTSPKYSNDFMLALFRFCSACDHELFSELALFYAENRDREETVQRLADGKLLLMSSRCLAITARCT